MTNNKLLDHIKGNNYVIPKYLIDNSSELNLNLHSFIILIYLINQESEILYDHKKISKLLNIDSNIVLETLNTLKEQKLITIEVKKNSIGIVEERIDLDIFYDKIFVMIMNDSKKTPTEDNIYSIFEKEFGRTLSPIEYEIISGWREAKIDRELILEALKQAVFNGVNNLRYIDKILFEWTKKGIKNINQVNKPQKQQDEKIEVFDYDWLNE